MGFGQADNSLAPLRITDEAQISLRITSNGFAEVGGADEFYVGTGPVTYVALNLEGETHPALDLASVPVTDVKSPNDLFLIGVTPRPGGGLLATVGWTEVPGKAMRALVRFDRDGKYDGLISLDAGFEPTRAAEFSSSGNVLVEGYDEHWKIKVALFDPQGKLLNPRVIPYADKEVFSPKGTAEMSAELKLHDHAMREAGTIQMASTQDDSVYLYNPVWGRKVICVQSNGKTTEMPLADPHANTMPLQMTISHGYLYLGEAILGEGQTWDTLVGPMKRFSISVYDLDTRTLDASYETTKNVGAWFVAASPRDFYFLNGKMATPGTITLSLVREQP